MSPPEEEVDMISGPLRDVIRLLFWLRVLTSYQATTLIVSEDLISYAEKYAASNVKRGRG
jgi:hypothetical protein